jgi:hypothetical protein
LKEKRKNPRIKTENLLSYEGVDGTGSRIEHGMGKTLDISQGGLLMETSVPVEAKFILLMSLDIKEEIIKIKGKVAYSREAEAKKFHTGVRFIGNNERINAIIKEMIKDFINKKRSN